MTTTQPDATNGRSARKINHTNIKIIDCGDCYKATEPASNNDLFGRGQSRAEAVMNYCAIFVGDEE
jgi:hypothetical protein